MSSKKTWKLVDFISRKPQCAHDGGRNKAPKSKRPGRAIWAVAAAAMILASPAASRAETQSPAVKAEMTQSQKAETEKADQKEKKIPDWLFWTIIAALVVKPYGTYRLGMRWMEAQKRREEEAAENKKRDDKTTSTRKP